MKDNSHHLPSVEEKLLHKNDIRIDRTYIELTELVCTLFIR